MERACMEPFVEVAMMRWPRAETMKLVALERNGGMLDADRDGDGGSEWIEASEDHHTAVEAARRQEKRRAEESGRCWWMEPGESERRRR